MYKYGQEEIDKTWIDINTEEDLQKIFEFSGFVLVDFWAPWCSYSREVTEAMNKFSKDNPDKEFKFGRINTDETTDLAIKYGVMKIPYYFLNHSSRGYYGDLYSDDLYELMEAFTNKKCHIWDDFFNYEKTCIKPRNSIF